MTMQDNSLQSWCLQNDKQYLLDEWDYDKNGTLTPSNVSCGIQKKVWWLGKCGHEWQAAISGRIRGFGCPYCASKIIVKGVNDLTATNLSLMQEWDYNKNEISPTEVTAGSDRKVWWKCQVCGNQWQATVGSRARGSGCPQCGNERVASKLKRKVLCIETEKVYDSAKDAGSILDICSQSIGNCCRGKSKTAGGYHWKYVAE